LSLKKGYHYAETIEFSLEKLKIELILKRDITEISTGNSAIALAILSAPKIFGRPVFFGGYPITPASDILHELAKQNLKEVIVKQAEDEIAAAGMALGAAYAGNIAVTASSGPGIDLKQEIIGLAHMAEIPLLIIDVQRAGPSTGLAYQGRAVRLKHSTERSSRRLSCASSCHTESFQCF
jgi:2-oxoglutarate ferredoxin oxidoreductase subunit alpha